MMDDILYLISTAEAQDANGVWRQTNIRREVMCRIESITRSEFYAAGRNGLNPDLSFTVFVGDYNGERTAEYHGKGYGIYRTYIVPGTDYIELYAERKGGTNGEIDAD